MLIAIYIATYLAISLTTCLLIGACMYNGARDRDHGLHEYQSFAMRGALKQPYTQICGRAKRG